MNRGTWVLSYLIQGYVLKQASKLPCSWNFYCLAVLHCILSLTLRLLRKIERTIDNSPILFFNIVHHLAIICRRHHHRRLHFLRGPFLINPSALHRHVLLALHFHGFLALPLHGLLALPLHAFLAFHLDALLALHLHGLLALKSKQNKSKSLYPELSLFLFVLNWHKAKLS